MIPTKGGFETCVVRERLWLAKAPKLEVYLRFQHTIARLSKST